MMIIHVITSDRKLKQEEKNKPPEKKVKDLQHWPLA